MAARQEESKKSSMSTAEALKELKESKSYWLKEVDLTKQTVTFRIDGGRIRGPHGNTVDSISVGPKSPWSDVTLERNEEGEIILRRSGVVVKVIRNWYAAEVD